MLGTPVVGALEGIGVVGECEGDTVGRVDGAFVGERVGDTDGMAVVGDRLGETLGDKVGAMVGGIGARVGAKVGASVGRSVGGLTRHFLFAHLQFMYTRQVALSNLHRLSWSISSVGRLVGAIVG